MNQITLADLLARGFVRLSEPWMRTGTHYPMRHPHFGVEVWPEYVDSMGSPRWSMSRGKRTTPIPRQLIPATAKELDGLLAYLRMKESKR